MSGRVTLFLAESRLQDDRGNWSPHHQEVSMIITRCKVKCQPGKAEQAITAFRGVSAASQRLEGTMRGLLVGVLLVTTLGACATVPTTARWDDSAARAAGAAVREMAQAFETMNLERVKTALAHDGFVATYELDLEGKPVRLGSRDEVIGYAEAIIAEMKKVGGRLKVDIGSLDCRATSTIGYCSMDYEFSATMPDGTKISQPSRTSFVLRRGDDGWKVTSWHTSLSQLPAPPPSHSR